MINSSVKTETGLKSTEKDGVINAVKSSTEVERNEESRISRVRGGKNVVEGYKKTSFSRMTMPISVLKLVEVW